MSGEIINCAENTGIATATQEKPGIVQIFELRQREARLYSESRLVPEHFRNSMPDCYIAMEVARNLGCMPFTVMQNMYAVHGKISWSSSFMIAAFNMSGRFSPIGYEMSGEAGYDDYGCRAHAVDLATGERLEGPLVTIGQMKLEGYFNRPGSKWKTLPELMLRYRAAAFFIRQVAPETTMGLLSREEAEDIAPAITQAPRRRRSTGSKVESEAIEAEAVEHDAQAASQDAKAEWKEPSSDELMEIVKHRWDDRDDELDEAFYSAAGKTA